MKYIYTSQEVQPIADAVAKFLAKQKFDVRFETPFDDKVRYRTTLLARKAGLSILVDVQNKPALEESLKELAFSLQRDRVYSELYIATHESSDPTVKLLKKLRQIGGGLILASETTEPEIFMEPQNPALIVCPDPTLRFGPYRSAVKNCLIKFNSPNSFLTSTNPRMDAARDMCEFVEGLTEELALAVARKKYIKLNEKSVRSQNWNAQIDTLASRKVYLPGKHPIIDNNLKNDLHSFRGVRNLLDHKVRTKREEVARQQQLADRMMMGPRLVATLVTKKQKL